MSGLTSFDVQTREREIFSRDNDRHTSVQSTSSVGRVEIAGDAYVGSGVFACSVVGLHLFLDCPSKGYV